MPPVPTPVAIRIDGQSASELIAFCDKDGGAYLIVKELEGSNPHFHCVLHSVRKLPAVRTALKRAMPELNGNGSYSVAVVRDLEKYQRYMCKGDSVQVLPVVSAAQGFEYASAEWLQTTHDAYWDENAQIQSARKRKHIIEAVLLTCKEAKYEWTSRSLIAAAYIKELVSRDKPINVFAAKSAINLIQVKLCPDDRAIDDLAATI